MNSKVKERTETETLYDLICHMMKEWRQILVDNI